jgi:hypothetical protein
MSHNFTAIPVGSEAARTCAFLGATWERREKKVRVGPEADASGEIKK